VTIKPERKKAERQKAERRWIPMPRPRLHASPAERQAAYRARHPEKRFPREDSLAALARSLHAVLEEAVETSRQTGKYEKCALPAHLLGARADETLRNIIRYVDPNPDPVRYGVEESWRNSGRPQPETAPDRSL
jgi:hypothetical protein